MYDKRPVPIAALTPIFLDRIRLLFLARPPFYHGLGGSVVGHVDWQNNRLGPRLSVLLFDWLVYTCV